MTAGPVFLVSGSDAYEGPLPYFRSVAAVNGRETVSITFTGAAQEQLEETWQDFLHTVCDARNAAVIGFSAGGHLALRPWKQGIEDTARLHRFRDAVDLVIACDPAPSLTPPTGDTSRIDALQTRRETDIVLVYPSIRHDSDRIRNGDRLIDVPYASFPYDREHPTEQQLRDMDRAHRFLDRGAAMQDIATTLLSDRYDDEPAARQRINS